jgi:putative transcriptional regulator
MDDKHAELAPPLFLLATPQVADPFFHKSLVLLVSHDDQGSGGFIVNRSTESKVSEVLKGMGISWNGPGDVRVYFGGPVQTHLGTLLFDTQESAIPLSEGEETPPPAFQGVRLSRDATSLARVAQDPPASFRLFLGYAGWGPGQLVEEILRNDWLVAPMDKRLLFSDRPDQAWAEGLRGVGLDPEAIATWVSGPVKGPVN